MTFWSKVEITSGQIQDKNADIFSDPPGTTFSCPRAAPRCPKTTVYIFFVVFSDFGPGSGLKSFGKIFFLSWLWWSLFNHRLQHRFWGYFGSNFPLKISSKVDAQFEATKPWKKNNITYKNMRFVLDFLGHAPVRIFVAQTRSTR